MPIRTQRDLPAYSILEEKENIFVMDEDRAMHQDIRPLEIAILNLMPLKEDTELQILRMLSNTPLQCNMTFMAVESHKATHTSKSHLNNFYQTFSDVKENNYDGLIITGAPVELMEFEEVDYWDEVCTIMDWAKTHVTSTLYLCWGAQAGLYHHYGVKKHILDKKVFGVFSHKVQHRKVPLVRGFDDYFDVPHSRNTEVDVEDVRKIPDMVILAESKEAGLLLCMKEDGSEIYCMGHPEYDRYTLDKEYKRDMAKGLEYVDLPKNYYPDDDPSQKPMLQWRSHANTLYTNYLNYYVYQNTPYEFNKVVKQ
ncbi:MAG: homoserine O-succinyltransferase [Lachnospiraceae bacterium]|nr:homoserine O-succinyltransferase [Lachnospiraceae bacterium]